MTAAASYTYTYRLGGIIFRAESDLRLSDFLRDKFQRFALASTQPDVRCRIRGVDPRPSNRSANDPSLTELLIRWLPHETLSHPWPLLHSPEVRAAIRAGLARPDTVQVELRAASIAITNLAWRRMDIFYQRGSPHFTHGTRHLSSGMILPFLPALDAALLHSSGIVCRGVGGLFLAPDGGGKTTLIGLIRPGDDVITDDQNLVHKMGDRFYASGLPWCRVLGSTDPHPLGGLFFLEKAAAFDLISLRPMDALERIALDPQNTFGPLPRAFRFRAALLRVEIVRQVPAYRLRFTQDYVDWDAVTAAMRAPVYEQATS
jgi:hypothetical protein